MKPVSCQTYVNPQQQLLVTRSNKPFQVIHEWLINNKASCSLVFVLTFSEVKAAFMVL